MLIEHRGSRPRVHPRAWVAPTAVLSGDVVVDADARVLHGAVLSAEDGRVGVGERCIVMEHALVRGRRGHPALLAEDVLVGPHAHVNGARIERGCFVATGAALFPGARLERGAEIRIHGVVHVNTRVAAGGVVPIGWVAVGDPARILPPERHDEIWAVQRELDFPGTVYGLTRDAGAGTRMRAQAEWYGAHREDRELPPAAPGSGFAAPPVERLGSGAPWEAVVGYSRTVRAGPLVVVAGTTALGADGEVGPEGDLHGQTLRALANVRAALEAAGARLEDVVRTRLSVTDIGRWEEAGRAHGEVFGATRPVSAMVEVSALIDPRMLVEVEATAWVVDRAPASDPAARG